MNGFAILDRVVLEDGDEIQCSLIQNESIVARRQKKSRNDREVEGDFLGLVR